MAQSDVNHEATRTGTKQTRSHFARLLRVVSCGFVFPCLLMCPAPAHPATTNAAANHSVAPDGSKQRKAHAPRKRKVAPVRRGRGSAQARNDVAPAATTPVSLLDAAGVKQLLARGTPPNDRPLLVNFWATWCEPCRLEFPDLVKIDADYRARGLQFVAISTDDPAELQTSVPKFLGQMRAQMTAYILNVTDSEPVINAIDPTWGGELPATFLFDRQGKVVFQHKGRINVTELRAALDKVLSAP